MMTSTLFARLTIAFNLFASSAYAQQGCILDPTLYDKVPIAMPVSRGDYDNLPIEHSLYKYSPVPQNQGSYGTCVGWAAAYAARTIQMAHQQNWLNTTLITENALSPFFVYESAKPSSDIYCQEGTSLYNGLEIMKEVGSVKTFDYPNQCGQTISKPLEKKALQYKIKDYRRLFDTGVTDKVSFVKKSIAENRPVIIGIQCCTESFQNAKTKYWKLQPTDNAPLGGHALTVIAYNDTLFGKGEGAFQLMNSWGTTWGEGGFIWMSYKDFNKYCFEAYEMSLPEPEDKNNLFAGTIRLELSAGQPIPFHFKNNQYESKDSYHSGTMFQIALINQIQMYVYVIGSDLKNQDYKIFPTGNMAADINYKGAKTILPAETKHIQMDNQVGTDYICLLYSKEPLQIDDILNRLKNEEGTFPERVQKVYQLRLFNPQDIDRSQHKHEITFKATSKTRDIVPIIVALKHID